MTKFLDLKKMEIKNLLPTISHILLIKIVIVRKKIDTFKCYDEY